MKIGFFFLSFTVLCACAQEPQHNNLVQSEPAEEVVEEDTFKIYTRYSTGSNTYYGFNSPRAINRAAEIDNEYFNNFHNGASTSYGRLWKGQAEVDTLYGDSISMYQRYLTDLDGREPKHYDCVVYAWDILQAGLPEDTLREIKRLHTQLYPKNDGYAGWSIGHILVKYFGWKAYLFIETTAKEYDRCVKAFNERGVYPVWRQPDIKLEALLIMGKDNDSIQNILKDNEFGWGFDYQGYHSWVTRYTWLKECNWWGSPSVKYNTTGAYVDRAFLRCEFLDYPLYGSHVVIFPPKKLKSEPSIPE